MKPVFKEEMDFLGIDEKYEGFLWKSKMCFFGFDDNLKRISFTRKMKFPEDTSNLVNWERVTSDHYIKNTLPKINQAKRIMRNYLKRNKFENYIISVSGGKDSTVTGDIVSRVLKEAGIDFSYLFLNTSNETHHTFKYLKKMYKNLEIINPDQGFYNWCIESSFIPSRFGRGCCRVFKEGNMEKQRDVTVKELQFLGMRRDESNARSKYKMVRRGKTSKGNNWKMFLPIIDFSDMDVWSYILVNDLKFNELYKFGFGRVGCTNCPFRSAYELKLNEEFLPTYDKKWKGILKDIFIKNGTATSLNCTMKEFLDGGWRGGKVREEPTDEVIEEYAGYKGLTIEKARDHFIVERCECGNKIKFEVSALNKKVLGRGVEKKLCLKCLAKKLETTQKRLKEDIEYFKESGCELF